MNTGATFIKKQKEINGTVAVSSNHPANLAAEAEERVIIISEGKLLRGCVIVLIT